MYSRIAVGAIGVDVIGSTHNSSRPGVSNDPCGNACGLGTGWWGRSGPVAGGLGPEGSEGVGAPELGISRSYHAC